MKRGRFMLFASLVTLGFLVAPILVAVPLAFSDAGTLVFPPPGFSTRWLEGFFARGDFRSGLQVSVIAAVTSTTIATILGGAAAYGLVKLGARRRIVIDIVLSLSLFVPILVLAVALLFFLARMGLAGSLTGIVVGHVILVLPLVIRTIVAGLSTYDPRLEEVGSVLGAPRLRVITRVVIPQVRTAISAGAALALVISLADVTIGLLLRGPGAVPLPASLVAYMTFRIDPMIGAASLVYIVLGFGFLLLINKIIGLESAVGIRRKQ